MLLVLVTVWMQRPYGDWQFDFESFLFNLFCFLSHEMARPYGDCLWLLVPLLAHVACTGVLVSGASLW